METRQFTHTKTTLNKVQKEDCGAKQKTLRKSVTTMEVFQACRGHVSPLSCRTPAGLEHFRYSNWFMPRFFFFFPFTCVLSVCICCALHRFTVCSACDGIPVFFNHFFFTQPRHWHWFAVNLACRYEKTFLSFLVSLAHCAQSPFLALLFFPHVMQFRLGPFFRKEKRKKF